MEITWTSNQMMAVALSRQIKDGGTYIIGTGLPLRAAVLAKNTHAPNAKLIFESGKLEAAPKHIPVSVADLRLNYQASVLWPMYRYFGYQTISGERGGIDMGFLGGAQIDPYGNLNSTAIGDYNKPITRLSGSGGANGISTYCDTFIIMKHEKRRFIEHVDYITSPGWIDGPNGRAKRGLNPEKGPRGVVTELCILRFDDETKRMYLSEIFPGVTVDQILENTGFELDTSRAVMCEPPTPEYIEIFKSL